jgi:hypothetical protein
MKRCRKEWEDANNKAGKSTMYMYVAYDSVVVNQQCVVD